jgi:uncharacterized membrane protein (UPF0127 family)
VAAVSSSIGGRRFVAGALIVGALAIVAGCSSDGSSDSSSPVTDLSNSGSSSSTSEDGPVATDGSAPNETSGGGVPPEGYTTIQAVITDIDGVECEICLWLADSGDERARGLMGVTDLGDADGMLFRFPEPTSGSFYMFQTPTPLEIAWFAPEGELVGTAEMAPCLDASSGECPLYAPDASYDAAIEVFAGGLEPLGIGPGSRLDVLDGTEAERCPIADGSATP